MVERGVVLVPEGRRLFAGMTVVISLLGLFLIQTLNNGLDILAVHIKPAYRETIIRELADLNIPKLGVMEPGRVYSW